MYRIQIRCGMGMQASWDTIDSRASQTAAIECAEIHAKQTTRSMRVVDQSGEEVWYDLGTAGKASLLGGRY